ncbi:DUF2934 domain-containing protein [Pseudomonas sp. 10S4]|uniref:DUF2934 domain-containing protein n=1 Tax=Pseudomonas sp. 10S4 TaxID=3048583 RepID=UPI002AC982A0|nr:MULTISPECIES: DUF2934 domain-containing protein [unclassified Pseudomonas]MEB0222939.1 DUF2934 domain-containing protein [Pseudomonas sp. 5S1]MEB0293017.1 DUF2934 domain-containing protein [Pseudomonas sp. 10S4]WPX17241.1 DUF2934 domain-containing protein [Pseudomonas sp. 10S4]
MDEQKIREAAYWLWESEGKPQGQDLEHWLTAEKSAGEEDFDSSTSGSTLGSENAPSQADSTTEPENPDIDGR